MSTPPTLAEVAGRNAQQIRTDADVSLERLAKACRYYELPWTAGRTGSFESGQVTPTLPTLLAVCAALRAVTGRPVTLVDLFTGPGKVTLKGRLTMDLAKLRTALYGQPVKIAAAGFEVGAAEEADFKCWSPALRKVDLRLRLRVLADFADGDRTLARSLKITYQHAAAAMASRWGKTFVAERDEREKRDTRAGARAQRRGHISRELKTELRKVLDD